MLVIPIAQENSTVRRTPWVTTVLIALNFLIFIAMSMASDGRDATHKNLREFFRYLAARPYLAPSTDITRRLGPEFEQDLEKARAEWRGAGQRQSNEIEAEQAVLDDLARKAIDALRRQPTQRFGYVPGEPRFLALLSSLFVHGGWLHLLGNMWFLFLTAPFIEDLFGRPVFTGLYLLSGVAATAAHAARDPSSLIPLIGASGAIAGVMGAFLVRLFKARIQFMVLPIPILWMLRFKVFLPAFVVLPMWFAEQAWYANTQPDDSVAFQAHVGGFVFGILVALVIKATDLEARWISPGIEKETTLTHDPSLEKALEARLAGDLRTARRQLRAAQTRNPSDLDVLREGYELALAEGDVAEMGRALPRLLEQYQRAGEKELADELANDKRSEEVGPLAPRAHLALANHFERAADGREAIRHYQAIVDTAPSDAAVVRALTRIGAILYKGGDLRGARRAYESARSHPACTDPWPGVIDKALAEIGARQA